MKILLVDQIAKTTYKYTFSLAKALKKKGIDLTLAIDLKKNNEKCNFDVVNLFNTDEKNISKVKKAENYIFSYRQILKLIKEKNIDIIHMQWIIFSPVDYYYLKRIKSDFKCKLVITVHDILPFNKKFYDYRFHEKIYALADYIIIQTEHNLERFDKLFPDNNVNKIMVPHGHYLEFGEIVDSKYAKEKLNIQSDKIILLFFGQIKKVKGLGILLEAFASVCERYSDVLLVIAGNVWKDDFSQYDVLIERLGIRHKVRADIKFIPDEDVKYYYSASDLCILPYLDVFQSGVVQLTYAHLKPAIVTNLEAFTDVIINEQTGFICEANDVQSLADTIAKALEVKDQFPYMAKAGYEYISKKFSWDEIADKIYSVYCSLYKNEPYRENREQ
ncbi:glycosyltransferase family 4 protein [Enterocloster bolteae]|uniref:glycosyltransferase family 4 protein n=1 Tax=Enterocloster bolteae TaxID=208479 RepID=UPI0028DBDB83|nr:glycosyltransferase family 4 protein [Enterocloster bolteae]